MIYKESFIDKLDRKYGRYGIRNLMTYIIFGMGVVFILDTMLVPTLHFSVSNLLAFNRSAIMHGQIWRLFTFIFIPPNANMFFILFSLYFYWMIGNALENEWGTFKFNLYYLCGILGAVLSGVITGYSTNVYLNLSLFLGFSLIYPDYEVLVFFILPVKMKYLAIIDAVMIALTFIGDSWAGRLALVMALGNVILFFWGGMIDSIKAAKRRREWKKNTSNYWQ